MAWQCYTYACCIQTQLSHGALSTSVLLLLNYKICVTLAPAFLIIKRLKFHQAFANLTYTVTNTFANQYLFLLRHFLYTQQSSIMNLNDTVNHFVQTQVIVIALHVAHVSTLKDTTFLWKHSVIDLPNLWILQHINCQFMLS